ncbi:MAG: hypothetical protein MUC96_25970 [Myxococcaceae bacterium]|jgi:hypothetical protein|nr:hypothetical protein [Myxococcaceae bacterium]
MSVVGGPNDAFSSQLHRAIRHERRRLRWRLSVLFGVVAGLLAGAIVLAPVSRVPLVVLPLMLSVGSLFLLPVLGGEGQGALQRLVGQPAPAFWLASPTSGVVALLDGVLLAGGVGQVPLDRHARYRVASVAYDEQRHQLTIDVVRLTRTRQRFGDSGTTVELNKRYRLELDRSVAPEAAYSFAREAIARAAR